MDTNSIMLMSTVYSWLSDEISREVYLSKINYLITGNKKYIDDIVRTYLPDIPIRNDKGIKDLYDSIPRGNDIVLFGASEDLAMNAKELMADTRVVAICDSDKTKQNKNIYGLQVISPEQLMADYNKCYVIITSHIAQTEIRSKLLKLGFFEKNIFELSPYIFCADNGQYFSVDFWSYNEEDGEIFVDDGCCNLQSTLILGKHCRNIRKVYAFEPDEHNYKKCKEEKDKRNLAYVDLIKKGTWSKSEKLFFSATSDGASHISKDGAVSVDVVAIDDVVDSEEKITFIKMDIEGAELESLKGAAQCIKKNKPKLAISIYHKPEDLYEIPMLIKNLVPEYRLFVRHHSNSFGETVLYATI